MKMIQDKQDAINISTATFEWCKRFFPVKDTHFNVKIIVSFDRRVKRMYGQYSNGVIIVYPLLCGTKNMLIKTILHEYKHFIQMPYTNSINNYLILEAHFDYKSNPYEIEANNFADDQYKRCYASLKRKKVL